MFETILDICYLDYLILYSKFSSNIVVQFLSAVTVLFTVAKYK